MPVVSGSNATAYLRRAAGIADHDHLTPWG